MRGNALTSAEAIGRNKVQLHK